MIFANSLDLDQDQQNVDPDLGLSCLALLIMFFFFFFFEKATFEKKLEETKSVKNYPACKDLNIFHTSLFLVTFRQSLDEVLK